MNEKKRIVYNWSEHLPVLACLSFPCIWCLNRRLVPKHNSRLFHLFLPDFPSEKIGELRLVFDEQEVCVEWLVRRIAAKANCGGRWCAFSDLARVLFDRLVPAQLLAAVPLYLVFQVHSQLLLHHERRARRDIKGSLSARRRACNMLRSAAFLRFFVAWSQGVY